MATYFVVDSKGHCFFCMEKIPRVKLEPGSPTAEPREGPKYFVQYLSRYLKLDLGKVINGMSSIPSELLANVDKSRLKVELCEECVCLNGRLSELCRHLEKIEMEIGSCLGLVHGKLSSAGIENAGEIGGLKDRDSRLTSGSLELLEKARAEVIKKCAQKVEADKPRVKIQKLTTNDISPKNSDTEANVGGAIRNEQETIMPGSHTIEYSPHAEILHGNVNHSSRIGHFGDGGSIQPMKTKCTRNQKKTSQTRGREKSVTETPDVPVRSSGKKRKFRVPKTSLHIAATIDDDKDTKGRGDDRKANDNKRQGASGNLIKKIQPKSRTTAGIPVWSIDLKTGKRKCEICEKEFVGKSGIWDHHQTVHLKVRFKCLTCGKLFNRRSDCKRHQESVHRGVRYACQICQRSFTQAIGVRRHQRKSECGRKLGLPSAKHTKKVHLQL